MITSEVEKTIVLQGRNIALSSEKSLLRSDPEFELYPLVNRILEQSNSVESVSVVDQNGIVQGDQNLVKISKPIAIDLNSLERVATPLTGADEALYHDDDKYILVTPVVSMDKSIGAVYLTYSKQDLKSGIRDAVRLTLMISVAVLILGMLLAVVFFRRISRPLEVMLDGVDALGRDLSAKISVPANNEFRLLAHSFNDMADRIAEAQKHLIRKERMDRELEIAGEIQQSLLPGSVKPPEGYEIGHFYQAANEVGGDYLDIIPMQDGKVGLVMGDVSGKGVPGLVVMAMVRVLTRRLLETESSPSEAIRKLNSSMQHNMNDNMFVTFFAGVLDVDSGELSYSNAGHNPLLIYNHAQRQCRFFKMEGPPLGVFDDHVFAPMIKDYRLELTRGDLVLQYTDGLNESKNQYGHQFTYDRIMEAAQDFSTKGAVKLVNRLVESEAKFRGMTPQFDDITLLAISARVAVASGSPG